MTLPQPKLTATGLVRISILDAEGRPQPRYIRASRIELIQNEPLTPCPTFVAIADGKWYENTAPSPSLESERALIEGATPTPT